MSTGNDTSGNFGASIDGAEIDASALERRERKVKSAFWEKFRSTAGLIPFADDLVAAYYCAMDTDTPSRVRAMLLGALAYFILPMDAIPDFIAGFGYTDDAAVLAAVVSVVARHIRPKHRIAAAKTLGKELPEDADNAEA